MHTAADLLSTLATLSLKAMFTDPAQIISIELFRMLFEAQYGSPSGKALAFSSINAEEVDANELASSSSDVWVGAPGALAGCRSTRSPKYAQSACELHQSRYQCLRPLRSTHFACAGHAVVHDRERPVFWRISC